MKKSDYIYHYTSIETLALILKYKNIRFKSLAEVDDIEESKVSDIKKIGKYCLVSCWTNSSEESIPLWNMYTPDMRGVRICLPKDPFDTEYDVNTRQSYNPHTLIELPQQKLPYPEEIELEYTDNENLIIPNILTANNDSGIHIDGDILGRYKRKNWSFQNEIRYRLLLAPYSDKQVSVVSSTDDFSKRWKSKKRTDFRNAATYIDFPIKKQLVDNITILIGPKANEAEKIIINALAKKYSKNSKVKESRLRIRNRGI